MAIRTRFTGSVKEIGAEAWSTLCASDNPFIQYSFFAALEDNSCIASTQNQSDPLKSGWQAKYLIIEDDQEILAIAPVFIKYHSYGEYVFDWAWADAYQRHGLHYFPKLVWAIPFTPSTGPRLITRIYGDALNELLTLTAQSLTEFCSEKKFSGWHCLFPDHQTDEVLNDTASARTSCQFHWFNRSVDGNRYSSFDHYLERFTSRKRKNVRKERNRFTDSNIRFLQKSGEGLSEKDLDAFYLCYQLTYRKRGMHEYLNKSFFRQLISSMPENIMMVQALLKNEAHNEQILACSLFLKDSDTLYGRYWGCLEEYDSLHFECCYYQGIEYCIGNGLSRFDPGTQGEHKISRGFEPVLCHSRHMIIHDGFREAIDRFLEEEQEDIKHYMKQASEHLPFRSEDT